MSVSPMQSQFVRIRAEGRDRAKFLHNFVTNNIKELRAGTACEVFFTDVKARILAHGYILAFEDNHEIWLFRGDSPYLLKHLNRYIITEDVTIDAVESDDVTQYFPADKLSLSVLQAMIADDALKRIQNECFCFQTHSETPASRNFAQNSGPHNSTDCTGLLVAWADQPILILNGTPDDLDPLTAELNSTGIAPLTVSEIESLRIKERYPIIGYDMTDDNLAPEAERNVKAISYTKGCYLGQEPIARLDAMGHVNRALRIVEIDSQLPAGEIRGRAIVTAEGAIIGTVTSASQTAAGKIRGLAMIKLAAITPSLTISTANGRTLSAKIISL